MFGHWSPVFATIVRWTPVEIAGEQGCSGPVKTDGDCRTPYLILAPIGTPCETVSINICQWPPRVTGGHRRPPVTFPAAGILLEWSGMLLLVILAMSGGIQTACFVSRQRITNEGSAANTARISTQSLTFSNA
ncbi:hypothetical protein B0H11DRAFT_1918306 [Mycena galericulata]|nr:hypothetical protein B0H11DRAFT_1918306 [Mycena galericulata]